MSPLARPPGQSTVHGEIIQMPQKWKKIRGITTSLLNVMEKLTLLDATTRTSMRTTTERVSQQGNYAPRGESSKGLSELFLVCLQTVLPNCLSSYVAEKVSHKCLVRNPCPTTRNVAPRWLTRGIVDSKNTPRRGRREKRINARKKAPSPTRLFCEEDTSGM